MNRRLSAVFTREQLTHSYGSLKMPDKIRSRYNINALDRAHVITNTHPDHLQYFVWGLLPFWSDDEENRGNLTEARLETITSQTSFRMPIRKKRCLVPVDSYYLWIKNGVKRIPFRIYRKDRQLMWIAGVWDKWSDTFDSCLSFAIINRKNRGRDNESSDRCPVLFSDAKEGREWLMQPKLHEAVSTLRSIRLPQLVSHRVSEKLRNPGCDSPELHAEVVDTPTLFQKI